MSRTDTLQERMIRTMPLPAPEGAVRLAKARLAAAALGEATIATLPSGKAVPGHEQQAQNALAQTILGAKLERIDASPDDWSEATSATWRFQPVLTGQEGASGRWLDAWGRFYQTPRYSTEQGLDDAYRQRILADTIAPGTTNNGMAAKIDRLLGIVGTQVVEAEGFFGSLRLDDGHRLDAGERFMAFEGFGAESLWNTFVVVMPEPLDTPEEEAALWALCDTNRGAGNRLLAVVNDGRVPHIAVPIFTAAGETFIARVVNPEGAATYTWTVTGGTILSGQGTSTIEVTSATPGACTVKVTQAGGLGDGKSAEKVVQILAPSAASLTVDVTEAPAGENGHTASVPVQTGASYEWEIDQGYILGGQGTPSITFAVGEADEVAGARCFIRCTVTAPITGLQAVGEAWVDIIPYPRTAIITTAALVPGGAQTGSVTMAAEVSVTRIQTNRAARVRIYESAATRDADIARPLEVRATEESGQIAEVITTDTVLDIQFNPDANGTSANGSKTLFYTIHNLDAILGAVEATVHFIQEK